MGIHGLLAQIGPGQRISLAKLSAQHYTTHSRPLRLAIDISIWLFQIQSGKGGSNPALRTFYYRLLRLLSLNIHPLFVFDGPNKPLFKRNKKVGGPGVRVASVPEFLAKQLLKQFAFPWHVAPGEAEAECALLQREAVVDAVLSEDVDTLMFGSGVTLRNWTAESSSKTPTHVDVHRAEETKEKSGMDREGMVLVALMSGGDYLPEGITGCGPKVACDAARAGFGRELCGLGRKDSVGLREWKERLEREIRTNESNFFSRKNKTFSIPEDFPNREVLGYYTHPCVSTAEKVERLRHEVRWDQPIDFAALRTFTVDAFDWRCLGGAKKFIKNLAPALLMRELRLKGQERDEQVDQEGQEEREKRWVHAIRGKRNHLVTDGELEYRVFFTPATLVPIDLSIEEEDDEFLPTGGMAEGDSDAESEAPVSTQQANGGDMESETPASPTKRNFRPYDPSQPEKLWILRPFLQIGCPLLVEIYEASTNDPKEFLKARRNARAAAAKGDKNKNIHVKTGKKKKKVMEQEDDMLQNALMAYTQVTKPGRAVRNVKAKVNARSNSEARDKDAFEEGELAVVAGFKMPSTQIPKELVRDDVSRPSSAPVEVLDMVRTSPERKRRDGLTRAVNLARAPVVSTAPPDNTKKKHLPAVDQQDNLQRTPRRNTKKRPSPDLSSPAISQRTITSYYSPSPRKPTLGPVGTQSEEDDIVNLISSSPAVERPLTPTPPNIRFQFIRRCSTSSSQPDFSPGKLPDSVTKRRKKGPLKRAQTAPVFGFDDELLPLPALALRETTPMGVGKGSRETTPMGFGMEARETTPMEVGKEARETTPMGVGKESREMTPMAFGKEARETTPMGFGKDSREMTPMAVGAESWVVATMNLITSSPNESEGDLPSPSAFRPPGQMHVRSSSVEDATPKTTAANISFGLSSPPLSPGLGAAREEEGQEYEGEGGFLRPDNDIGFSGVPPIDEDNEPLHPLPRSNTFAERELPPLPPPPPKPTSHHHPPNTTNPPSNPQTSAHRSPPPVRPNTNTVPPRRSPRQQAKHRIQLRESLEGAWKEVDAEMLDLTGDGGGWKKSGRKAKLPTGWRRSGVEVLDLTGA